MRRMLSQAPAPTDWRARSACLQVNPELFFPVGSTGPAERQVDQAKLVCQRCEVREAASSGRWRRSRTTGSGAA